MADKIPASTTASTPTPTTSRVDKPTTPVTTVSAATTDVGTVAPGKTVIADNVISKVAGIAAREVPGVYALGGGAARAFGAIRDVIGSTDLTQGVRVEVGETQVAADVTIVVEYPTPMNAVAEQVRGAVAQAITQLVGMEVAEVNVAINDVHIPGDDDDDSTQSAESRVA
ncbi:hypothetical protein AX769_02610 [Frondihabitans sp. PAMC 28766]|uniref:Asp23/Gls24 family envelope stress response protein n=1 Tax=Frondihabitans sp. PAMC 28766 TaxID=1795630 RepID=UPI00078B2329|nr:Asp23/Gls24 family envelope stress response protein [Frondihabitans sp. PAMC 28766]AMM19227.1 hypothetical protein AX769_02610 [Frondihabitans sp. PAMC 28766]